jgi:hypothetical protein
MIDWRSYFCNAPNQNVYAKGAKGVAAGAERVPFADLHTNFGREELSSLEDVLRGRAIELWSDALGDRFWLVADEHGVTKLGEPRGNVYTAAEARRVVQVGDPAIVREIHEWKQRFDGRVRKVQKREPGKRTRAAAACNGGGERA